MWHQRTDDANPKDEEASWVISPHLHAGRSPSGPTTDAGGECFSEMILPIGNDDNDRDDGDNKDDGDNNDSDDDHNNGDAGDNDDDCDDDASIEVSVTSNT